MKNLSVSLLILGAILFCSTPSVLAASAGKTILIKTKSSPRVYALVGGKREYVSSPAVLKTKGYSLKNIQIISEKKMSSIPLVKISSPAAAKVTATTFVPSVPRTTVVTKPLAAAPAIPITYAPPTMGGSNAVAPSKPTNPVKDTSVAVVNQKIAPVEVDMVNQSGTFISKLEPSCGTQGVGCARGFVFNNGAATDLGIGKVASVNSSGDVLWQKNGSIYSRVIIKKASDHPVAQ